ncbi:EAL domain-containing protein [Aquisalimonas sp.]|uniref:EAL domain-containing protein n=1 Tax=Aquisalimonas sp. TaxID=1872621 RepID=UPI0025BC434D|nr:EAL domain-containing protein [Aquisalimonas sp.]
MTELLETHTGLIYQLQGLAFIALGVVALILPRRGGALHLARTLWLLAAFALLHGLAVFIGWEIAREPAAWLLAVNAVVLPTSYLALLEFGRRTLNHLPNRVRLPSPTVYPPLTLVVLAVVLMAGTTPDALFAASRIGLGLPAALLAAWALWAASAVRPVHAAVTPHRSWLRLAAVAMAGYGLMIPVLSTPVPGLPEWLPTQDGFLAQTGVPIRLSRALATVTMAVALVGLVRRVSAESSEDHNRLLGTISGFIYRCDNKPEWPVSYLAGNIKEMTGYDAADFLDGKDVVLDDLVHPDDKDLVWRSVQEAMAERREFGVEYRCVLGAGKGRWFYDRGRGVFDDKGELRFLEGHTIDVTPLRVARTRLERFRATLDRTLDAVFIFEAESLRFTYVNEGAQRQTGYSRDELLARHPYELTMHYPESRYLSELVEPLLSGDKEVIRFETEHLTRDGGRVPVEVFLQCVAPGDGDARFVAIAHDISERLEAERILKEANDRLEQAEQHARLGHWEVDLRTGGTYWSQEMYRLMGFEEHARVPSLERFLEHVHHEDRDAVRHVWTSMPADGYPVGEVFRTSPEVGPVRYLAPTYRLMSNGSGLPDRFSGTVQDVTGQHRMMEELRQSERQQTQLRQVAQREQGRMAALLSGMSIGILFEDRTGLVEYVNPAFKRIWSIDVELNLVGRPTTEVLEHSTHRFSRPDHASKHVLQVLDTHEISERFELDLYDGRILTQVSYPVSDTEGRLIGRLWIYEDVTHERQTAQQLVYLAEHDPLTGLHNRHRFQEHLDRMLKTARRLESRFALMYFDLDDFKHINDNFGHRAGDTVLVRAAGEVSSLVRGGEVFARLGGDEFAILAEISSDDEPTHLAKRILHAITAIPLRFRGSNLRLTASLGIALFPAHGTEADDLVAHADAAMYQAKNQGKNTWAVYDPERSDTEAMLERMSWSQRIAQALDHGRFELHFQGVYHAADRTLSHLEALVRMQNESPHGDLLMPGQFIPLAEKTGQIMEIDRWVLRCGIETLQRHPSVPALAVNVSGRSIDEPGLPHFIRESLEQHGVDPGRLIIEITETAAVAEMQNAQRFIEQMHQTGCAVCLDDFGSGFSTFAYLKYLAVRVLKIDGMFVQDLPNNPDNQAFVRAMIDVSQGLGKRTVAEFVENEDTLQMLRSIGVDLVQGYHLDSPVADHPSLSADTAARSGTWDDRGES